MIGARIDSNAEDEARAAARQVGLRLSDLIRIGLAKVVAEIHQTGRVEIPAQPHPNKK